MEARPCASVNAWATVEAPVCKLARTSSIEALGIGPRAERTESGKDPPTPAAEGRGVAAPAASAKRAGRRQTSGSMITSAVAASRLARMSWGSASTTISPRPRRCGGGSETIDAKERTAERVASWTSGGAGVVP